MDLKIHENLITDTPHFTTVMIHINDNYILYR